jgi:hypothetical protein
LAGRYLTLTLQEEIPYTSANGDDEDNEAANAKQRSRHTKQNFE